MCIPITVKNNEQTHKYICFRTKEFYKEIVSTPELIINYPASDDPLANNVSTTGHIYRQKETMKTGVLALLSC